MTDMPELTKKELEQLLKSIIHGLDEITVNTDHTYYENLYPEGLDEGELSGLAIRIPELHPLMVELAEKIIEVTTFYGDLWAGMEEQAGSYLTTDLAMHDKQYCRLFADCLAGQDLSHEVNQNDDIRMIVGQWGLCDETATILIARQEDPGQHGPELMAEMLEKYGDQLQKYLDEDEWYDGEDGIEGDDEEYDEEDEEDEEDEALGGHALTIQDKRTLESLNLHWEEGYPRLTVMYLCIHPEDKDLCSQGKVFEYATFEALEQAVAELAARSEAQGYVLQKAHELPMAKDLYRRWAGNPDAPPAARDAQDVLDLFTPAGLPTPEAQNAAKLCAGKPQVACRKILLYKDVDSAVFLFANPDSNQVYTPNEFSGQYLWSFDSAEEMEQGLAQLIQDYRAKGYELVLEETVDYAFEHCLKTSQEMLGDWD